MLLTNDGALLHRLISPKHRVPKIYEAEHDGESTAADVEAFQQGIVLRDGDVCLPAELTPLWPGKSRIVLHEGKYHQVRRMMASRGLYVRYLKRVAEGPLELGDLSKGACRVLEQEEILQLQA